MSSDTKDSTNGTNAVKAVQVTALPIGSGGNNQLGKEMSKTNEQMTMMMAQANANSRFDPPTPAPVTKQVVQAFCSDSEPTSVVIGAIGCMFIIYGLIAK